MTIVTRNDEVWQEPEEAAAITRAQTPPSTSEAFSGMLANNPTAYLQRRAERSQFDPSDWFFDMLNANATAYGAPADQLAQRVQSDTMQPEKYNELYAPRDDAGKVIPIGDTPMPEKLAMTVGDQMRTKRAADNAVQRFEGANSWPTNLAVNMAADMVDPINASAMLLPGLGEEAVAARLGFTGANLASRTAVRAISGATFGAAQEVPVAGLKMALAPGENTDYGFTDALKDTLLSGASMAAFTTGLGTAGDALKWVLGKETAWHLAPPEVKNVLPEAAPVMTADATTQNAAQRAALAQVIDGKPIDVADFFPKPPDTMTAVGLFTDHPYMGAELPGGPELGFDRDQVARQLEPELFSQFDDAATRRATLSRWYNEMSTQRAVEAPAPQADLQARLDELRDKMQSATKKQRATMAAEIADIHSRMGETEAPTAQPATPQPASPVEPPLPTGSIADIDTEIARLQTKAENANRAGREKIARRIENLKDQQERLAREVGVPNPAETIGPERFEQVNPEYGQYGPRTSPFVEQPPRPLRLTEFLATEGGIRDDGGDLRTIVDDLNYKPLAKVPNREVPIYRGKKPWTKETGMLPPESRFKKLFNDKGLSLDEAAERAQEAGYFPDHGSDVYANEATRHDLLNAIQEEIAGNHRYSLHDEADLAQFQTALAHNHEIDQLAQQHGIDPKGMSRAQFFDTLAERQSIEELADHIRSMEDERQALIDDLGEHFSGHPDLAEGDILDHPEHGPMLYEGPATLEDLLRVHDEAPAIHAGQSETTTGGERPVSAAGRAEQGEGGVGQNGRADRIAGGVGAETSRTPAAATGGDRTAGRTGPTLGDQQLANIQRQLAAADYRMRDLAVQVSDAYRRADQHIAIATAGHAGNLLDQFAARQAQFAGRNARPAYLQWQRDFSGLTEREKAWKETGVAPGIAQPELAKAISDVKAAASRPLSKTDPRQVQLDLDNPKPPEGFGDPFHEAPAKAAREKPTETATEGGKEPAATKGRETEQATPAKAETATAPAKPETFDSAWIKANHTDKDGAIELAKASDEIGSRVNDALDEGATVTLHTDGGREVEITNAEIAKGGGYKLLDSSGNAWGIMPIATDASGKIRLEIHPRETDPFPGIDMAALLPQERAELEAAQAAVEHADKMEGAYDEAAQCLKRAGA
jgi:hypothetical protein